MGAPLQIGQVAKKTGLTVDTIRFYEKSGLLTCPARTEGGYRLYREQEVADLEFIQQAQQLGFSLNEIRELFSIQRHPDEVCDIVRTKIVELQKIEADLAGALRQCRTALRKPSKQHNCCPVLQEISAARSRREGI
jgi:DNA-binding transcriptional MerR regulator